jgi:hypothetical protein
LIARIVLWSLADSQTTLVELRESLSELPERDAWISDEAGERFGLISFEEEPYGLERFVELIGKEPELAETFDVEEP